MIRDNKGMERALAEWLSEGPIPPVSDAAVSSDAKALATQLAETNRMLRRMACALEMQAFGEVRE